jgi:hypothetical protein
MFQLVYFSTADSNLTKKDIESILERSRNKNSTNDITGCLLNSKGEFLQMLEGEEEKVKSLFSKIEKDSRHHNVILLKEQKIEKRAFQGWSMAFHDFSKKGNNPHDFQRQIMGFSKIVEKPTAASEIFWTMAEHLVK